MMPKQRKKAYYWGLLSEYIAMFLLWCKGYKILCHRYKTYVGEVDIIALKKGYVVCVEVKARKHIDLLAEVVSHHQQMRIKHAAGNFMSRNNRFSGFGYRFDLMFIMPWRLPIHIQDAWQ